MLFRLGTFVRTAMSFFRCLGHARVVPYWTYLICHDIRPAKFGPVLSSADTFYKQRLVRAQPFDGCSSLLNADLSGTIVLIKRGSCVFRDKVAFAQHVNASAVIIMDNTHREHWHIIMAADPGPEEIKIPSVFISFDSGQQLLKLLNSVDLKEDEHRIVHHHHHHTTTVGLESSMRKIQNESGTEEEIRISIDLQSSAIYHIAIPYLQEFIVQLAWKCGLYALVLTVLFFGLNRMGDWERQVQMKLLPQHVMKKSEPEECIICLEEYQTNVDMVKTLPCGHEFHAHCIDQWFQSKHIRCPLCNQQAFQLYLRILYSQDYDMLLVLHYIPTVLYIVYILYYFQDMYWAASESGKPWQLVKKYARMSRNYRYLCKYNMRNGCTGTCPILPGGVNVWCGCNGAGHLIWWPSFISSNQMTQKISNLYLIGSFQFFIWLVVVHRERRDANPSTRTG